MSLYEIEGVDYSPEGIERLRQDVILSRDDAIVQGAWYSATLLSHVIALLAYLKELVVERNVAAGSTAPVVETAMAQQQ